MDRQRFRPQQWSTSNHWRLYSLADGETWNGSGRVQQLDGLPSELLIVPLRGHTLDRVDIVPNTTRDNWFLNAADAYFFHEEMHAQLHCTPGMRMYQWMLEKTAASALQTRRAYANSHWETMRSTSSAATMHRVRSARTAAGRIAGQARLSMWLRDVSGDPLKTWMEQLRCRSRPRNRRAVSEQRTEMMVLSGAFSARPWYTVCATIGS
jgi:hypothetical protein